MLDLLLFGLVWFGHACIWTVMTNKLYSLPYSKPVLRTFRLLFGIIIFIVPPVLYSGLFQSWFQFDAGHWSSLRFRSIFAEAASDVWAGIFSAYAIYAIFIGWIGLPFVTIRRRKRTQPVGAMEVTQTVDVTKELGFIPAETTGKRAKLARKSWNELFQVDFTTLHLQIQNLPERWEGLSILQLSDLHFVGTPTMDYYRWVMDKCMAEGVPDLLCITGDLVDSDHHHRWIIPTFGRLRWKYAAFGILGNHDWVETPELCRRRYRRLGIQDVGNRWLQMELLGEKLTIIGHEGPWFRPIPDLTNCPENGFRLCLSHTPDNYYWAQQQKIDLMLSGHNHGGQICVPVFGPMFVPSWYSRRYDQGTFLEKGTWLHVNRGLGGKAPIRTLCHPQVTRIFLHRAAV